MVYMLFQRAWEILLLCSEQLGPWGGEKTNKCVGNAPKETAPSAPLLASHRGRVRISSSILVQTSRP